MRSIAFVLAAFVASGPAAAQSWQEYSHPNYSFAVSFPADRPHTYENPGGSEARYYNVIVYER